MNALADLTGQLLAQAVLAIADGGGLFPLLCADRPAKRQMIPLGGGKIEAALSEGREWLAQPPVPAARAVFVFDGYLNRTNRPKQDALVASGRLYAKNVWVELALPYRPAGDGFAVGAPHVLRRDGLSDEEHAAFFVSFWQGVKAGPGAPRWAAAINESL